ncbi:MAG: two-partner secretion domain-containing protein [Methylophilus sp.]|uniref:two-partner secretion domain-containing protein n=1 Tax=Methylophilus sp. TaxID=29541 RepID=UPI003FA03813
MKAASLNHVYRLVWSHVQNAWTVVAETARTKGKKSTTVNANASVSDDVFSARLSKSAKWAYAIASGVAALYMPTIAQALPSDGVLNYGHADFVKSNNDTTLDINQTTAILKASFVQFNIDAHETVNLNQAAGARAMFVITGNDASKIAGKFNVDSLLFFINPNGVYFSDTAQVNVGSIVVSPLSMKDDDFLNGTYRFTGANNTGSVINHGVIKAKDEGFIVLLGKTVENTGTLVANNGSVVLGSAQEATLDFYGNGLVRVKLSGDALEAAVKNSGLIQANGGLVQLATSARSAAINITGIVEANQLVERDGVIRLEGGDNGQVQVSGQLIAKGENTTGGTIAVTGEQVALLNGAVLDASGDKGGGKVLVGGDYQGKNEAVYNAQTAYVGAGATIKADAIQQGDGGTVVVWADQLTRYYGDISAQGGAASGNGGFVEVSGKQDLDFHGGVDVGAVNGAGGTVLLDPTNIILSTNPQLPLPDLANGTPDIAFGNPGTTTTVNVNSVKGFNELFLQATNNITVSSALTMTKATGSVRLEAGNDINVNANITSGTFGKVTLKADADGIGGGNIAIGANITGSAGVTLSAATITHTAGNINTTGSVLGIAGDVKIDTTGSANLGSANINANGGTGLLFGGDKGGEVKITANSLTMTGNINTTGGASFNPVLGGGQGGAVTITTANGATVGNITTSSGNAGFSAPSSRLSGAVNITNTGNGDINAGNINSNGGTNGIGGSVTLDAKGGSVKALVINTSAGASTAFTQGMSAGNVKVNANDNIDVGTITANGGNGVLLNPSGGAAGKVELIAANGTVNMGAVTNLAGTASFFGTAGKAATVFAQAGGDLNLNGNILTSSRADDAVQLVAGGNFKNNVDATITTGTDGNWTIYSNDPTGDVKGTNLLAAYDYKQYGTTFGGALLGTGNGFVHAVSPTVTATLNGTATKTFDGNNVVTDVSGLSVTASGALDGDIVTITPTPITAATYDNAAAGTGKPIDSTYNVASITTREGKQIFNPTAGSFNGYTVVTNSNATGTIVALPAPVTALGFASPRDDAGLGGLIPNNPALNTMTIVSLNPAAGDEEDLDAVACPVNEDSLGSTPVLNSGVKLPDGVSSNCI